MSCKHRPCRNSEFNRKFGDLEIWRLKTWRTGNVEIPRFPHFQLFRFPKLSGRLFDFLQSGFEHDVLSGLRLSEVDVGFVDGEVGGEAPSLDQVAGRGQVTGVGKPETAT